MIRLEWLPSRAADKCSSARSSCTDANDVRWRDSCRFQNLHNSLLPLSTLVDILSVRLAKTTTRATQSEMVVRLSFLLREHRHNKSRQAQILERGASRSAAVIRHYDQFEHGDIREFNLAFLDFAYRVRWTEIPLLAHDFSKRASAIRRPPQDELLGALYFVFLKD